MRKTAVILISLFIAAACLAGCKGPYLPRAKSDAKPPMQFTERIIFLEEGAAGMLLYINSRIERMEGGQVLVKVNLQNRSESTDLWADVKTVFYDRDNMRLEETPWSRVHFPAMVVTLYKVNSMRPDIANFTVMVRNLRSKSGGSLGYGDVPH